MTNARGRTRAPVLAAAALLLATVALAQEDASNWTSATADKLGQFLPPAVPGLAANAPWQNPREKNEVETSEGIGTSADAASTLYAVGRALQHWTIDDPDRFKAYAAWQGDRAALINAMNNDSARIAQSAALQRQMEEAVRSGRANEIPRFAQKMAEVNAGANQKMAKLEQRGNEIIAGARLLDIAVEGNATPANTLGPSAKASGAVRGRALYRSSEPGLASGTVVVDLAVYVGPADFQNPERRGGKTVLKCVLVHVRLTTRPEAVKADEALANRMLAAVDFDGIAKLLAP